MFLNILLLVVGFGLLIKGADWLVEGASAIALKFNIPKRVIALSLVALGTSLPELVVSTLASINGQGDIAVGNVVGSNIFNLMFTLGIICPISGLVIHKKTALLEVPLNLLIGLLLFGVLFVAGDGSKIGWPVGLMFLLLLPVFLVYLFQSSANPDELEEVKEESKHPHKMTSIVFIMLIGILGLGLGGNLVVNNATDIAIVLGISEQLIALTIIALGTSLPELVTSFVAALKKQADVAIGNVIGSNIINVGLVLGTSLLFNSATVSQAMIQDAFVLLMATLVFFGMIFAFTRYRIAKIEGAILLTFYFSYLLFIIQRG